ncbi:hypothetical protein DM01DRAFT_1333791 [Hesseltinella vesiculosa]|uniref:RNI-like protein n=1 Tax=Hesseltinella vesiculosa TaxID=101127 RepID=A0A1X2GQ87_9FUNG|nr:hypothetical protein DM01DRAFT_1333791 [Hesseltinella vesiculosa]
MACYTCATSLYEERGVFRVTTQDKDHDMLLRNSKPVGRTRRLVFQNFEVDLTRWNTIEQNLATYFRQRRCSPAGPDLTLSSDLADKLEHLFDHHQSLTGLTLQISPIGLPLPPTRFPEPRHRVRFPRLYRLYRRLRTVGNHHQALMNQWTSCLDWSDTYNHLLTVEWAKKAVSLPNLQRLSLRHGIASVALLNATGPSLTFLDVTTCQPHQDAGTPDHVDHSNLPFFFNFIDTHPALTWMRAGIHPLWDAIHLTPSVSGRQQALGLLPALSPTHPHLTHLALGLTTGSDQQVSFDVFLLLLIALCVKLPNLDSLDLSAKTSWQPSLRAPDLDQWHLTELAYPRRMSIDLDNFFGNVTWLPTSFLSTIQPVSVPEDLSIFVAQPTILLRLLRYIPCHGLQRLHVESRQAYFSGDDEPLALGQLLDEAPALKTLTLTNGRVCLTASSWSSSYTALSQLHLTNTSIMGASFFETLGTACPAIESLLLRNCQIQPQQIGQSSLSNAFWQPLLNLTGDDDPGRPDYWISLPYQQLCVQVAWSGSLRAFYEYPQCWLLLQSDLHTDGPSAKCYVDGFRNRSIEPPSRWRRTLPPPQLSDEDCDKFLLAIQGHPVSRISPLLEDAIKSYLHGHLKVIASPSIASFDFLP